MDEWGDYTIKYDVMQNSLYYKYLTYWEYF